MGALFAGLVSRLKTFWPMLAGIVCARTALIAACYGSYTATDDGVFTDGAMLIVCVIFAAALLALTPSRRVLSNTAVQWALVGSTLVAAAASGALSFMDNTDPALAGIAFALSVISTLALSLCMFYWLRCLRGTDEVTAALFVFATFMASVVLVYGLSFLPERARNIVGTVFILAQLALVGPAALRDEIAAERMHRRAHTFFTFARSHIQDARFLIACTVGMGLLSFVDGFLRGYPDGLPIPFTPTTRLAYPLLTLIVCVLLAALVVRRRERVMTLGIFLVMEALAAVSLVLFGAFPLHWEIGAVPVSTLNIVICAYCWYVIIAFTNFGDRDPYIYAMGGWVICFGSRSVARMLLYFVYPLTGNDLLVTALLGALILLSAQVVLVQFLLAEHREETVLAEEREAASDEALAEAQQREIRAQEELRQAEADVARAEAALAVAQAQRCIRCTEGHAAERPLILSEASRATGSVESVMGDSVRGRVRAMGEQFLLSDREVDVLALYAMGYTQKKVAEELFITPATAHTHIKRIYAKCGMHSRQEILEYLASWGS